MAEKRLDVLFGVVLTLSSVGRLEPGWITRRERITRTERAETVTTLFVTRANTRSNLGVWPLMEGLKDQACEEQDLQENIQEKIQEQTAVTIIYIQRTKLERPCMDMVLSFC